MIPSKKKTPEEIAALREGLGIPPVASPLAPLPPPPPAMPEGMGKAEEPPAPAPPQPASDADLVTHLDPPASPIRPQKAVIKPSHSLRKQEIPLAPAPVAPSRQRTELPARRHDPRDVAQIRKREALAQLRQPGGEEIRTPKSNVRSVRYLRRSLMPEGLLDALGDEQVSDLLAYLMTLK